MESSYKRIAGWPENLVAPKSGKTRPMQILTNIVLLLPILLFFIYADLIRRNDHMPKDSPRVRELVEASRYGPTVFPILFTLVVGGSLRSLAFYRLQAGERIGFLDLLFGSTTLGSAIETLFERRFGYFDISSLGLLVLWALSPLGGQATLRVIGYDDFHTIMPLDISYVDYTQSTFPFGLEAGDLGPLAIAPASAFVSSLSCPLSFQTAKSDLWGNVKVPVLEALPDYSSARAGDWVDVPTDPTGIWYASFIGVPIANIPRAGQAQFQAEVAYWELECPSFRTGTYQDIDYTMSELRNQNVSIPLDAVVLVDTPDLQGAASTWGWILSNSSAESLNQRCRSNSTSNPPRRQLMYWSWNTDSTFTVTNCTMGTSYVEISVGCDGWSCGVDRVRRSLQHPTIHSTASTSLDPCDELPDPWPTVPQFFNLMLKAVDNQLGRSTQTGLLQFFMQHPNRTQGDFQDIQLTNLGNETFAQRFSVLLNTYWVAIYNYNLTSSGHANSLVFDNLYYDKSPIANSTGTTTLSEGRFVFNRVWYAVLIISSSTLFFTALGKLVLDLHILIPELQMNASTLLRGNMAYCPSAPNDGSAMDDGDRSRLLRYHRVRFGYRPTTSEYGGELGIGELDEEEGPVVKIAKGQKYY
ncbi:hypothetical protein GGR51DRAFT_250118 [Nemania sp. FL0031]|nr:hypothetical protein GGR51DRAFT_250118 [Nemania sp. FL0031]